MKDNFDYILNRIFAEEGGYVDHPSDPGGATNMGITRATLATWRNSTIGNTSKMEVKNLTKKEASEIYRKKYWNPIKGDELPGGIDMVVMDYGVNSGVSRSVKLLQAMLGVTQDGVVGPNTIKAAWAVKDTQKFVHEFMDNRLRFLKGLKTWPTFSKGWQARVNRVRAEAAALAQKSPQKPVQTVPEKSGTNTLLGLLMAFLRALFGKK